MPRLTTNGPRPAHTAAPDADGPEATAVAASELSGTLSAPRWLRDLGFASWMLAGVAAVLVGAAWIASLTSAIVVPVVVAGVIASVLSPVVRRLDRRMPRAAAAALVFLGMVVLAAGVVVMIIGGVTSQASELTAGLGDGADQLRAWLEDLGVSAASADQAQQSAGAGLGDALHTLVDGAVSGISGLASLAVFLSFTALSLFLMLKDGPAIRRWAEHHLGVPPAIAHIAVARTLQSLRGYFAGVTAVAAFNGVAIGLGALVIGVPQAGSIAVVNFAAAYIPFLGAWSAGAFTVLVALGGQGTEAAVAMAVIVLLANGLLQQMLQPLAMGAALGIHPLAVLIVTIAAGALLGMVGMVVAAPLVSAAVRISADLKALREPAGAGDAPAADGVPAAPP